MNGNINDKNENNEDNDNGGADDKDRKAIKAITANATTKQKIILRTERFSKTKQNSF